MNKNYNLFNKENKDAYKVLCLINEIESIYGFEHFDYVEFDEYENEAYFSGSDSWIYGGYEEYNYEIPLDIISNLELRESYLTALKEEQRITTDKYKDEKDKRYETYLKLKNEFDK